MVIIKSNTVDYGFTTSIFKSVAYDCYEEEQSATISVIRFLDI
jgi:hypothetical protein